MRLTRQQAINQMCKSCIYDQHSSGTWKMQVAGCTAKDCPLYPYRPLDRVNYAKKKQALAAE